jgi:hypothetical protein
MQGIQQLWLVIHAQLWLSPGQWLPPLVLLLLLGLEDMLLLLLL